MGEESGNKASRQSSNTFGLWLTLMIVLALLGVAGAGSYALLQHITRVPTAADVAARVCTAYTTQNYSLLISQIDPTPVSGANTLPNQPSPSGPFDANAQTALVNTLKNLDASAGPVINCQQQQLAGGKGTSANPLQFTFVMHRSTSPGIRYSFTMNFVQHNGNWMIRRDSNFVGTPS